jgi:hypothetical protein
MYNQNCLDLDLRSPLFSEIFEPILYSLPRSVVAIAINTSLSILGAIFLEMGTRYASTIRSFPIHSLGHLSFRVRVER